MNASYCYEGEELCRDTVCRCMYEMLSLYLHHDDNARSSSTTIGSSNNTKNNIKMLLCERTTLMTDCITIMSDITQRVVAENDNNKTESGGSQQQPQQKRSRDMKMSNDDQWWIKMVVELVGTLCYHNVIGQTMLRDIEVDKQENKEESSLNDDEAAAASKKKNGLHVLLETSRMSLACFGLRERVVVAVRYALEDNRQNQAVLEQLDPQQALMSPELASMGIHNLRIDDKGKVRVSTTRPNEDTSS